jgi:hypothetical protein
MVAGFDVDIAEPRRELTLLDSLDVFLRPKHRLGLNAARFRAHEFDVPLPAFDSWSF